MSSLQAEHLLTIWYWEGLNLGNALSLKEKNAYAYAEKLRGYTNIPAWETQALREEEALFGVTNEGLLGIQFQREHEHGQPSHWYTPILLPHGTNISNLQKKLKDELAPDQDPDITRRVFRPLTDSAPYKERKVYRSAQYVYDHGLCLPVSVMNEDGVIERVCEVIKGER
jgi:dTDP-4-amino-4,6-dideoxygalactose transaminase